MLQQLICMLGLVPIRGLIFALALGVELGKAGQQLPLLEPQRTQVLPEILKLAHPKSYLRKSLFRAWGETFPNFGGAGLGQFSHFLFDVRPGFHIVDVALL